MASSIPTISALRACLLNFEDDDSIQAVWHDAEGQKLLKQVSLLVRREESKNGQASISPRSRALKAITSTQQIDPPCDSEMRCWIDDPKSFWTIRLNFESRQEVDMVNEALASRLRMISYLDQFDVSLRVRRRFLCLFFYDFARRVHPNAERLGVATIRSVTAQLQLCGIEDFNVDQLKALITVGRRLDELFRMAGPGAIFCLPKEADEGTRLEQLGELVHDLAQWLLSMGVSEWSEAHDAGTLGVEARKMMIESMTMGTNQPTSQRSCTSMSTLDFMFVH